jgi:hypothetical protein
MTENNLPHFVVAVFFCHVAGSGFPVASAVGETYVGNPVKLLNPIVGQESRLDALAGFLDTLANLVGGIGGICSFAFAEFVGSVFMVAGKDYMVAKFSEMGEAGVYVWGNFLAMRP